MRTRTGSVDGWSQVVAENVRRLRAAHRWTLRELAAKLAEHDHPLGAPALSEIERGRRRIDVEDVAALATAFGAHPYQLMQSDRDRQRESERVGMVPVEDLQAVAQAVVEQYLKKGTASLSGGGTLTASGVAGPARVPDGDDDEAGQR